jgi:outer membrane protein assembly factor BamD (BamD/ComL family)
VDFPTEEAGFVVEEFLKACHPSSRKAAYANLMRVLTERAPEWGEGLECAAERAVRQQS